MDNSTLIDKMLDEAEVLGNDPKDTSTIIDKLIEEGGELGTVEDSPIDNLLDKMISRDDLLDSIDPDREHEEPIVQTKMAKLSMHDLDDLTKVLKDNAESSKEIMAARNTEDAETISKTIDVESEVIDVAIDSNTGIIMPGVKTSAKADVSITEIPEDFEPEETKVTDEDIANNLKDNINLTDGEALELVGIIRRLKANEKFSVFSTLPEKMKNYIRKMAMENNIKDQAQINSFARVFMEQFVAQAELDKAFIDYEEAIKKELNIPSVEYMYYEYTTADKMDKIKEKAKELEEIDPEKAAILNNVYASFESSYTYDRVIDMINNNRKVRSRLKADIVKYNRFCEDFIYKFKNSKFNIHDISMMRGVLTRKVKDLSSDEITMFCNCIWKSIEDVDITSVADSMYAYFIIKNILSLDHIGDGKTDFSEKMVENIHEVVKLINHYVKEKEESDSSTKKKKGR